MAASTLRNSLAGSRLDTSYTSFESERGVRSPRTPTYVPDSPLAQAIRPFDHTKFSEPSSARETRVSIPPPTEKPMGWIWICHLCHSRYTLGVTRRCLIDGHYYCSGESDKPSMRKKKKQKACSSEFDYAAWKQWGDWRRKVLKSIQEDKVFRGCEYCDFPSQCRYPVDTHPLGDLGMFAKASVAEPKRAAEEPAMTETEKVDLDQILESMLADGELDGIAAVSEAAPNSKRGVKSKSTANEKVDFDQILKCILSHSDTGAESPSDTTQKRKSTKKTSVKSKVPSLELDLSPDLHELVEMDWSNFEDIALGKSKTD